ncbi:MAG: MBL fold metallo-hydrolase [Acidobacteriota bacterium]
MTKNTAFSLLLMFSIPCLGALPAAAQEDTPFRVNKVNDRVTVFSPGGHAPPTATTVITTEKGLIVIDTGLSPTLAEWTRRRIFRELGRDDVVTVINTHAHFDHTDGNQIYAGAEIIAHESVPAAMRLFAAGKQQFIAGRSEGIGRQEQRLKTLAPGSQDAIALEETIRFNKLLVENVRNRYTPTLPTRTFSDRLTLNVADLELPLYSAALTPTATS